MSLNREQFIALKAKLLCFGVAIDETIVPELLAEYPDFFVKGFINAVNLHIGDSNLSVSVAERFSAMSDIVLKKDDGGYYLQYGGEKVPIQFFPPLPKTGTIVDELARLHAPDCINIWPSTVCCYDTPEQKCKFCSLNSAAKEPIPIGELASGLKKLLAQLSLGYTLNFSGGTYKNPDRMAQYWRSLTLAIREFSGCPITIELAPPSDLSLIAALKESGVTVVILNLEIADDRLRKEICPGKSNISYEHYYAALKEAVRVFGKGQVSSVLIGGIQPWEDILRECERLASIGVFPTIMPFRPFDDCTYALFRRCDPDELVVMSEKLGALLREFDLNPACQPGCTKCGGCSIENDCYHK